MSWWTLRSQDRHNSCNCKYPNLKGGHELTGLSYVNSDRARTKKIVAHAADRGVKALFITVDAPQLGRREKDMRTKFDGAASSQQSQGKDNFRRDQGAARAISSFIDPSLNWADLPELTEAAKGMKIILKGVQCWEVCCVYQSGDMD